MGWCHNVLYLIPPTTSVNWKLLISGWTSMPWFNSCALLDKVLAKQYLRMNTYSIRNESCVINSGDYTEMYLSLKPTLGEIFSAKKSVQRFPKRMIFI